MLARAWEYIDAQTLLGSSQTEKSKGLPLRGVREFVFLWVPNFVSRVFFPEAQEMRAFVRLGDR